jgi:hypothetical protein
MRRRAIRGECPSELDYRQISNNPERFLLKRHKRKLDRALRMGMAGKVMERRGLFDPFKHHQAHRAFKKAETPAQKRSRTRLGLRHP